MTTVTEPARVVDLDAIDQELVEKIDELSRDRQRLALAAMSDNSARARLSDIEAELSTAQGERQRLDLARAEQFRLDAEARQEQLDAERAAALKDARRLQARRQDAAAAVDATAREFAAAVLEYAEICGRQQVRLLEAGYSENWTRVARFQGYPVEAALACALRETGAAHVPAFERLPVILPAHQKPLADSDPRVVEPLADKTKRTGGA
jgi:hypothetical protein